VSKARTKAKRIKRLKWYAERWPELADRQRLKLIGTLADLLKRTVQ